MQTTRIPGTDLRVSRIALGTWAIGGWMWGGTDERRSIETIHAAIDRGVTLIDTAPVYGFGTSEAIVGKALAEHDAADGVHLSTKVGLEWDDDGGVFRNASRDRIQREIDDSLKRLGRERIDVYHVHWPDPTRPIEETADAMRRLVDQDLVAAVGVSNFTPDQMDRFRDHCPIHVCQPPYNIFERGIESAVKPYCERNPIALMTYGALCRGLLTGKMTADATFEGDDLRNNDPKFAEPRYSQYLRAAERLETYARDRYGRSLIDFSVRWLLEMGVPIAIWGGRKPEQMAPIDGMFDWTLDGAGMSAVDSILAEAVEHPVGPEFMAPPTGLGQG
jgi:aryl-alcohol dehydrogenase-like predicted oxidoreductase